MRFSQIVGHPGAVSRLTRAVTTGRVAGAYLLGGPAGIGKRALAEAFAAALLCDAGGSEGCGECPQCVRVDGGTHPDLLVITREEDRRDIRTEQVRELIRWFGLRPLMARRKIALLDGAEHLNDHGQNALLKTLEEPRGNAVLLLVSAAATALLPTVRSRCQLVRCEPLSIEALTALLIARGVAPDRAPLLASHGHGSLARALEQDNESFGQLRERVLAAAGGLSGLAASDLSSLAQELSRAAPEVGLRILASWYRDVLGSTLGDSTPLENPDHGDAIGVTAAKRGPGATLRQLELVCDTIRDIERNANRMLAVETLLLALREIEWTNKSQSTPR